MHTCYLQKTAVEGGDQLNVVMSTYSIWNLLAILNEGASGTTANQLQAALRIPADANMFRVGYKAIGSSLMVIHYLSNYLHFISK